MAAHERVADDAIAVHGDSRKHRRLRVVGEAVELALLVEEEVEAAEAVAVEDALNLLSILKL